MNLKKYLYINLSLLYFDLIFNLFLYNHFVISSIVNIILFDFINALLIVLLTSVFSSKINKIFNVLIYVFLLVWYSFNYIFYKVLITPFSIALFRQSDQTLKFGWNIVISILQNIHIILLFSLPLIILLIFRKKINYDKLRIKYFILYICLLILAISLYVCNIFIQGRRLGSIYNLYYENNNVALNIKNLGVMAATYLDIKKSIFGIEEKIMDVIVDDVSDDEDTVLEIEYNTLNIDFSGGNGDIAIINNYMNSDIGTSKNEYTGLFRGKNLIFIVAESFSEIAVSEKYTPTLYKLIHEGFYFKNFYTSNNLSTIGGEFQALTGIYADNTILSSWRGGTTYYPYGLGTVFKKSGYNTFAYHDNSAYYQDRNVYLKSQGFDNYKGCYNGLEKLINCEQWPQSDVEMINATIDDYINSEDPFITYYMTVSGHFYYTFSGNSIAKKNQKYVNDLNYPEEVKGYIATQIELDSAIRILIDKLDEANKLDDTVIVLLADHYPYNLSLDNINLLSTYPRDQLIEANSNALIIYNSEIKSKLVEKVSMSIDVLPTVLNLFGISYDSRLLMGKDILSDTEGVAIFKDRSWVTNKGTYYASSNEFISVDSEYDDNYVNAINSMVNNRVAMSRMIVINDYYNYLFKNHQL